MNSPISALPDAGDAAADRAEAARGLEALFLRQLLAEMRGPSRGGLLDGGTTGRMFRQMLDEALADTMAEAGGIGLARAIEAQLGAPEGEPRARIPLPRSQAARRYAAQPREIQDDPASRRNISRPAQVPAKTVETKPENGGR